MKKIVAQRGFAQRGFENLINQTADIYESGIPWTAQSMGRKGGRSRSPRKVAASRENARKASITAGRKRKAESEIKPESLKRRARREHGKS